MRLSLLLALACISAIAHSQVVLDLGCTDSSAENYNLDAIDDNGNFEVVFERVMEAMLNGTGGGSKSKPVR